MHLIPIWIVTKPYMGTSNVTLIQKSPSFVACNFSHISNTVLEGYINELNDRVIIYVIRKKSFLGVILIRNSQGIFFFQEGFSALLEM